VNNDVLKKDGKAICELTDKGDVKVDLNMKTSLKGLFAAGDIRQDAAKQVVCAAGDGSTAAIAAISYVEGY
jgi:thioredoxin reductase (NADPH)